MVAWFERMAPRERAALLAWASAAVVVGALALGYGRAPQDCFYSPEDFARCDPWRAIGAIGDVAATALMAAALWTTRNPATTALHKTARAVGVLGLALAVVGSLAAAIGDAYLIARPIAAVGFGAMGLALAVESDRGNALVRSRLGMIIGITLALWAIAYVPRDDWILPTGGLLFFAPYVIWAVRMGYRLGTGMPPVVKEARPVQWQVAGGLAAVFLLFLAFPAWLTSTFGVTSIGDRANFVAVTNATGEPIFFYDYRGATAYRERIDAGETKSWDWLEHAAYPTSAEDLTGTEIYCRYLHDRELRRAHYRITVVRDPLTCQSR
jgi:hypothetical protein